MSLNKGDLCLYKFDNKSHFDLMLVMGWGINMGDKKVRVTLLDIFAFDLGYEYVDCTYWIEPAHINLKTTDLNTEEMRQWVETILSSKGIHS